METEVLETVLKEVLGELKEVKLQQAEQTKSVTVLIDKVQGVEAKVSSIKIELSTVDTTPIEMSIDEGISKIKSTIESQPKSVI